MKITINKHFRLLAMPAAADKLNSIFITKGVEVNGSKGYLSSMLDFLSFRINHRIKAIATTTVAIATRYGMATVMQVIMNSLLIGDIMF